ncbi:hypothetical protein [uncultured Arthrobacter sp.]|uniref:hypothetical protein n=1 Tax=uncultured Arthrobacter sp. TaxID=114050 RepID=UPI00263344E8|nr:hypothetical protein [uncultured Arthrobacter sp.]
MGNIVSYNTTGQTGNNGGQDDSSRYPAGQQWQQPTSSEQSSGQQSSGYGQSYGQQPAGYGQAQNSPYGTPGGYGGGYGQPAENPGKTLGIVGLICSIIWPISIVGLIVSIIAMVKSRKAGMGNGFALAGIIIGAIGVITGIIAIIILIVTAGAAAELVQFCQTAGPGMQEYQGVEVDCTPFQQ